ncbi:MAG: 2-C-methyl-D-erythritol 4-phosphate cytidylyltransferase, partial [Candidatus Dadabacteria bacterium]|nr:2-C-methyl-D-erythritol 4-phosphate cytidylyltransferase [Candidatus Dadabacteria bacterium]
QTPQAFEYTLVKNAHLQAIKDNITNSTDDCYLTLRLGSKVYCVLGDEQNIKITYPIDHHIADKLFQLRNISNKFTPNKKQLNELKGKVFIIIGGTSGIGLAINNELKNNSAKVYPLSRNTKPRINIRDYSSVEATLEKIWKKEKRVDYIINCAGI